MESVGNVNDLIKSCLLPELKEDLDSIPIEKDHFKEFHQYLETRLPLLYDYIQQKLNNISQTDETNEATEKEVQAYLFILLFEISSPNAIFKLDKIELIHNADKLLQNSLHLSEDVDNLIFKYYEDRLHKDKWKRQLGAVHGFIKYLKFRLSDSCNLDGTMNRKMLIFCLSVALNARSCYETHYKALSTAIFIIMMHHGDNDDIISMNIHSVIYDAVFKDISKLDSVWFITKQWDCLLKCLGFYKSFDSFTWNYLDDMMEVLLRNVSLSPDSATSLCLLKYVSKLIVYFTMNNKEFEKMIDKDLTLVDAIDELRTLASCNTSYTCYRWAKNILQTFIIESYKLLQTPEIAEQMLEEVHKIYILTILPLNLSIVEPHLINFFDKFIAVLMETVKVHKCRHEIIKNVTSLLETFHLHLQSSENFTKLFKYKLNIARLLETQIFKNYTTSI